jgi:hypothetical protein
MERPQKVTAHLKVTAEFYDPEATPETVRASVEQTLKDSGFEVEVANFTRDNNSTAKPFFAGPYAMDGNVDPDDTVFTAECKPCTFHNTVEGPWGILGGDGDAAIEMPAITGIDAKIRHDYIDFASYVTGHKFTSAPSFEIAKSYFLGSVFGKLDGALKDAEVYRVKYLVYTKHREDIMQELIWYRDGKIPAMQPVYVDALIEALKDVPETNAGKWVSVKDMLPDKAGKYLIVAVEHGKYKHVTTAMFGRYFYMTGRTAHWIVTHWMPLPEPPEE